MPFSIFAKAPDITVDKFLTVVIINLVVPINAPKVDINLPTIKIAGPIAATNKPALTIKPCVSGLSDLKPSTNLCNHALNAAATASYDTAFFDYSVRSGSNARAGQIMAIQSGSSVNYTETTTTDFGSTTALQLMSTISSGNMIITGSTTTAGWTIKGIIRSI